MRAVAKALGADKALSWNTPDPCSPKPWDGVGCDTDGRVTDIQVGKRRLTGTLAPEVRNLTALARLEVFGNTLSGALPSLAGLASLQHLLLNDNGSPPCPTASSTASSRSPTSGSTTTRSTRGRCRPTSRAASPSPTSPPTAPTSRAPSRTSSAPCPRCSASTWR
ncbi:hypothetical protein ACQ4PT_028240 [Festuca glaucescens]